MKKRLAAASPGDEDKSVHLAAIETLLFGNYPAIMAHLATTRLDDGSARTPGTLLLRTAGSSWTLMAKEPDECLQMQVHGQTLDDVFVLLELLLSAEKAPWEPDPWAKARQGKSKK